VRRIGERVLRLFGSWILLLHGDPMVLDRWRWISRRLYGGSGKRLLDAGCGNGWLAANASRRGFQVLGLGWADSDLERARRRCQSFGLPAEFEVQDLRGLDARKGLYDQFDTVVCSETIEHILDDQHLMRSLARVLRPGGRLLLTTPNVNFTPIGGDVRVETVENGGHVRKGYGADDLKKLCDCADLDVVEMNGCSGHASQLLAMVLRSLAARMGYPAAWALTLPLRVVPLVLPFETLARPHYSICLYASKARSLSCDSEGPRARRRAVGHDGDRSARVT
jgi:SAM-dependent methyltransferase